MNQSSRLWVLISGALCVIILFGGYVFAIQPAIDFSSDLDKSLIENKSTLQIEDAKLQALSSGASTGDLEERVNALEKAIPGRLSDPTFFAAVNNAQNSAGVVVDSISIDTDTPQVAGTATGYPITLSGSGAQNQAFEFIRNLQSSERLILLSSVDFTGDEAGVVSFNIVGRIFQVTDTTSTAPTTPVTPAP